MKHPVFVVILLFVALLTYGQEGKKAREFPRFMKENVRIFRSDAHAAFTRIFGMEANDELKLIKTDQDQLGFTHDKYQQYYKKVKVEGAVWSVHSRNGLIESYSGEFRGLKNFDTTPVISAETGFQQALNHVGAKVYAWENSVKAGYPDYSAPKGELVIIGGASGDNQDLTLAWKYDMYAADPLYRAEVFINAKTGEYVKENQLIHHTNYASSGITLYNGLQTFTSDWTGSVYRLRQTVSGGGVQTYTLKNSIFYFLASDITSSNPNSWSDATAIQAHWGAERTYAYYKDKHGRNSFNNSGAIIKSYVHYSTNYVNAFWDGSRMTYGDGDLSQGYRPLVSIDICGHEITHGVTTYEANLTYSNESGALNESFSDIFGECIENYAKGTNDWMMSCDIGVNSCGAFRNMINPNAYGDPDTYKGDYWYSGTSDNGGVHINCGVMNKWFHILTVGESGTNDLGRSYDVAGIGMEKAARIAYRNLTVYLSASSVYADARVGALQSAADLFGGTGSTEYQATAAAWDAVGVYALVDTQPPTAPVLSCPSKTQTSITLSWTASTDNVGVTGYDLYKDGSLLASNLISRTYTVDGLAKSTSYSFYVVAKDAAGNTAISNTLNVTTNGDVSETVVGAYNYNAALSPWVSSNKRYCLWNNTAAYIWEGAGSVKICYKNITCTSPTLPLTGYSQVEVKFYFTAVGMEAGKTFTLRYSSNNGSTWSTVATFTATTTTPTETYFTNGPFYLATVTMNSTSFNNTAKFRIHINGTSTSDIIYFDEVTISGRTNTSGSGNSATLLPVSKSFQMKSITLADPTVEGTVLYPNPAADVLNIKTTEPVQSVKIFSLNGSLLVSKQESSDQIRMDISALHRGIYLVEVITGSGSTIHKMAKQ